MEYLIAARLQRKLIEKKRELLKTASGSLRNLMLAAASGEGARVSEEDLPASCQSETMIFLQCEAQRSMLRNIERALGRLSKGEYGLCEECGEEIGEGRLSAVPFALCCSACQEERERTERMTAPGMQHGAIPVSA